MPSFIFIDRVLQKRSINYAKLKILRLFSFNEGYNMNIELHSLSTTQLSP